MSRYFWMCYDHLGGLFLTNLVWSILNVPYLILAYGIWQLGLNFGGAFVWAGGLLAINLVFLSPMALLLHCSGSNWVRGSESTIWSAFSLLRKFFWRAQLIQLISLLAKLILVMNVVFYSERSDWIGLLLTGLMVWALFVFFIFSLQLYPLLVTQDTTVISTIKFVAILGISHPLRMFCNFCVFVFYALLGVISGVGLFVGIYAAWVLWASIRCQSLLSIYTGKALEPATPRSFRELSRPWET